MGGVGGDGEDEDIAVVDGADDFLAPHGGALDAGFVDPYGDASLTEARHQVLNALPIGRAVADEYFLCHVVCRRANVGRLNRRGKLSEQRLGEG